MGGADWAAGGEEGRENPIEEDVSTESLQRKREKEKPRKYNGGREGEYEEGEPEA